MPDFIETKEKEHSNVSKNVILARTGGRLTQNYINDESGEKAII
jgi:hypothetical protein